jgi:RNA polymerase sigma-70 factor (ECF subfamily)
LAAPLAIAVAAALVVGFGVGNEQPAAARQLQHAAKLVAGDAAPIIGPGQYWYVKGLGRFANGYDGRAGSFTALQTSSHEIWMASDGSGRIVRADGPPEFFSAAERARWEAAGKPGFQQSDVLDEHEAAGELSWGLTPLGLSKPGDVPSDPYTLEQLLDRGAKDSTNAPGYDEFQAIAEILRDTPLSGAQTAAFYEVLAMLPGVELAGAARDGLDRLGTVFAFQGDGPIREEIILDPDTGRMLGSRSTLTRADATIQGAEPGAVLGAETVVATGVVDSTSARP